MSVHAATESSVVLRTSGDQLVPEELYDQILESNSALVMVDTPVPDDVLRYLRQMAQRRGHSIYHWQPDVGLSSLREHGITVAASKRLPDALRFVLQSAHFGVYVFPADKQEYTPQATALLRQIARGKDGGDKRVLVLGSGLEVVSPLDRLARLITHRHGLSNSLRLRDGRWIRG